MTHRTARSGDWENPYTWLGREVPADWDNVILSPNHILTINTDVKVGNVTILDCEAVPLSEEQQARVKLALFVSAFMQAMSDKFGE